jgi:hypothetical protein
MAFHDVANFKADGTSTDHLYTVSMRVSKPNPDHDTFEAEIRNATSGLWNIEPYINVWWIFSA